MEQLTNPISTPSSTSKPGMDVLPPTPVPPVVVSTPQAIAVTQAPAETNPSTTVDTQQPSAPEALAAPKKIPTQKPKNPHTTPMGLVVATVSTMIVLSAVAVAFYVTSQR